MLLMSIVVCWADTASLFHLVLVFQLPVLLANSVLSAFPLFFRDHIEIALSYCFLISSSVEFVLRIVSGDFLQFDLPVGQLMTSSMVARR